MRLPLLFPARAGALLATVALAACTATSSPEAERPQGPVAQELEAQANATREKLPPEALEVIEATNVQLAASGITEAAMQVGEKAPNFTLPDAQGQPVTLSTLLKEGPAVVTFYRGKW